MEERKRLEDAMAADVELVGDNEIANLWDGDKKLRYLTTVAISCAGDSIAG